MQCEVVVGSYEGTVKGFSFDLLHPQKGLLPTFTEDALTCVVKCIASSAHYLAIGGYDSTIKVYNMRKRCEEGTLLHHSDTITSLSFYDNTHLFSTSEDSTIAVWRVGSWECLRTLKGHKGPVYCIAVHPSGKLAVSVSKDRTLRTWDLIKAKAAFVINLKTVAHLVCWDTIGSHYAVALQDTVNIFSVETGDIETVLDIGKHVNTMVYVQEDVLAVGSDKTEVELYSTSSGAHLQSLTGHMKRVKSLAVAPGNGYLFSLSSDEVLKVWRLNEECNNPSSITCVSEVTTACLPVCMVVITPSSLVPGNGRGKGKMPKPKKSERPLSMEKKAKRSTVELRRHSSVHQRTKCTYSKRQHFSRKVLLRYKHWHW